MSSVAHIGIFANYSFLINMPYDISPGKSQTNKESTFLEGGFFNHFDTLEK